MESYRVLNTMETTSIPILSLKSHTTNIKNFGSGEGFHASIYNVIAYNIIQKGNGSSPNLVPLA